jgi:hypothetical protein
MIFGSGERPITVRLDKLPHCHMTGSEDISVYVFFPQQYDLEKVTNFSGKGSGSEHALLRT